MMTDTVLSKDALVGVWKIVEVKNVHKEKEVTYPYGENPVGYSIYTQEGYMSVSIMMNNRLTLGLPLEEIRGLGYGEKPKLINIFKYIKAMLRYVQAGNNYVAYTGKYEIKDNKLINTLKVNIVPDLVGLESEYSVEVSEEKLVLMSTMGEYNVYSTFQRLS